MTLWYPPLIHHQRDTLNGHRPASNFYRRAIEAENYLTQHGKCVFTRAWLLGNTSYGYAGTTPVARFRFWSGYGSTRLRIIPVILKTSSGFGPADPDIDVVVTEVGVGSTTASFSALIDPVGVDDVPTSWSIPVASMALTPNAAHEVLINLNDYARLASIDFHEVPGTTIVETTDYFNAAAPSHGTEILDTTRSRLLVGLSNMWRRNGATIVHWGLINGAARTRTSATAINLIDNATAGAPTAATPGWSLDTTYRRTHSKTTVPFELAVYGSMSAGSGTVTMHASNDATVGTVTLNNATPQWFTATATITAGADKFDLKFTSDGANTLSVYAVSLNERDA